MGGWRWLAIVSLSLTGGFTHSAAAQCMSNPISQSLYTLPNLPGHLAYDSAVPVPQNTPIPSSLYLFDFQTKAAPRQVSAGWGLTQTLNPNFSPDGKWITFSGAINNGLPSVYVWRIGAAMPVNLTPGMSTIRNEDPKFSNDQRYIIFKQEGSIKLMTLGTAANGDLYASSVRPVTTGGDIYGSYSEASAPFLSADGQTAYYSRGSDKQMTSTPSRIYSMALKTLREQQLSPVDLSPAYYPVVNYQSASSMLFYVGHNKQQGANDQIYLQRGSASPVYLTINACDADNSDPAPVDADFLIFSRDGSASQGGLYQLYLANINTSMAWNLSLLGINSNGNNLEGAAYTPK